MPHQLNVKLRRKEFAAAHPDLDFKHYRKFRRLIKRLGKKTIGAKTLVKYGDWLHIYNYGNWDYNKHPGIKRPTVRKCNSPNTVQLHYTNAASPYILAVVHKSDRVQPKFAGEPASLEITRDAAATNGSKPENWDGV